MATNKFNNAVTQLLNDHVDEVIAEVAAKFKEAFDFEESEVDAVCKEIADKLKVSVKASKAAGNTANTGEKKKRAPTAYNLYIKDKMAELKVANPALTGKELMSAATAEWKKDHPKVSE